MIPQRGIGWCPCWEIGNTSLPESRLPISWIVEKTVESCVKFWNQIKISGFNWFLHFYFQYKSNLKLKYNSPSNRGNSASKWLHALEADDSRKLSLCSRNMLFEADEVVSVTTFWR